MPFFLSKCVCAIAIAPNRRHMLDSSKVLCVCVCVFVFAFFVHSLLDFFRYSPSISFFSLNSVPCARVCSFHLSSITPLVHFIDIQFSIAWGFSAILWLRFVYVFLFPGNFIWPLFPCYYMIK